MFYKHEFDVLVLNFGKKLILRNSLLRKNDYFQFLHQSSWINQREDLSQMLLISKEEFLHPNNKH